MRRLVHILLFLMLVDEGLGECIYAQHMFAPFAWVHGVLFVPVLEIRPFDAIMAMALLYASLRRRPKGGTVRPMRRALFIALGTILVALVYGLARGGSGRAAGWQVYLLFSLILTTFTFASICQTTEHFVGLIKTVVAAGFYHAVMGVFFYLVYVRRGAVNPVPAYMTFHDDTVLWTVGVGFLLLTVLQTPTTKTKAAAAIGIPFLLLAIQVNNRRLAWISLGGALLTLYVLIPPSAAKKRIRRIVFIAAPVLALYALVGWGRSERIFRPLQAFQSVSAAEDNSTKARNVENLGLIATASQGWVLGTGWGHRYIEISNKYQIYFLELWPYVPHNSVLGLFAYTGLFGFLGIWMPFPTAAYLHARTARLAPNRVDRFVGLIGVVELVACADQWYGDMGSFSRLTTYTLATCFAAALRIPASAGVMSEERTWSS